MPEVRVSLVWRTTVRSRFWRQVAAEVPLVVFDFHRPVVALHVLQAFKDVVEAAVLAVVQSHAVVQVVLRGGQPIRQPVLERVDIGLQPPEQFLGGGVRGVVTDDPTRVAIAFQLRDAKEFVPDPGHVGPRFEQEGDDATHDGERGRNQTAQRASRPRPPAANEAVSLPGARPVTPRMLGAPAPSTYRPRSPRPHRPTRPGSNPAASLANRRLSEARGVNSGDTANAVGLWLEVLRSVRMPWSQRHTERLTVVGAHTAETRRGLALTVRHMRASMHAFLLLESRP